MHNIVWIAVISGLIILGGAHLVVWSFLRAQRRQEGAGTPQGSVNLEPQEP